MPTSTPSGRQTPSSSLSRLTLTDPVKTRSICEIYEVGTPNSFFLVVLFSQVDDPITFEEVVNEALWAQVMDEEI